MEYLQGSLRITFGKENTKRRCKVSCKQFKTDSKKNVENKIYILLLLYFQFLIVFNSTAKSAIPCLRVS